jgi:hypothetical protein
MLACPRPEENRQLPGICLTANPECRMIGTQLLSCGLDRQSGMMMSHTKPQSHEGPERVLLAEKNERTEEGRVFFRLFSFLSATVSAALYFLIFVSLCESTLSLRPEAALGPPSWRFVQNKANLRRGGMSDKSPAGNGWRDDGGLCRCENKANSRG